MSVITGCPYEAYRQIFLIFLVSRATKKPKDQFFVTLILINMINDFMKDLSNAIDAIRGTQREYSSKPLKHSIVERILVI